MAFESFSDLARSNLKRSALGASKVVIKSEFKSGRRTQTVFRFAQDLVDKAGWTAGADRVEIFIDRGARTIKLCRVPAGGYKLLGGTSSRPNVKFTVARGMPSVAQAVEVTDVIVVGGEVLFTLPEAVTIAAG